MQLDILAGQRMTQASNPAAEGAPLHKALVNRPLALVEACERVGVGIAMVDAEGHLRELNTHFAALLGLPRGQLCGRSIFDPELLADVEEDQEQFRRQVAGEIETYTIEQRFHRIDGTALWVTVTSTSVLDDEGRFLYAVRSQQDITDRKETEAQLSRRAEERAALYGLMAGLQHSLDPVRVYDLALDSITRALGCDRAAILLFDTSGVLKFVASRGLSESYRHAVEGHSPWTSRQIDAVPICVGDVGRSDLKEELRQAIRAEGIGALSFIPISVDGRLIGKFMTYYDRPHGFVDAEMSLGVAIARQLASAVSRMRSEAARQSAERAAQQLVAIVESSRDAIVSKDLNGTIMTWNRGAERLFGYRSEEAVGRPITIIIPKDRLDEEPDILARIRRGEKVDHFETVRRRKDGRRIDISLTISPVRDSSGNIVGASKIARDITEQKLAEAKLRNSEQQLADLLSSIPAAIYTTDAEGKITYFNQAAVDLAGRTPEVGSDEWCVTWKLYRPDGTPLPHDQCPMAVALREGRPIRNAEAIAERPDGSRVPFIPYPTPLHDSHGRIVGAVNMLVDVSERRQAETQQRVLFDELNHRVKNNMQMLQSILRMASERTSSHEASQALEEAGRRVAAMVAAQRVLYTTAAATSFKARHFLGAVTGAVQQSFPREANIICEAGDIELSNDAAMPLALILSELLTNAMKHGMPAGGGGTVRVALKRDQESHLLLVEDDGPGFVLSSVRQRCSGLQLVQGLARQLRGNLQVTRNPRNCCIVRFYQND
jgi:PAS domain S-box-containing protein